ncbi:sulfur oxidation c-type cytochrome SoxX [Paracoccus methylarcula]|uniref:Sulfur oxidation c-type cytochrome SoxX n=1 Tax=Paracoccus methylarcula TaxID=72022 RepID=A0A422QZ76_9RHOB|nr:sulfur oxidation c-type cytochrome SoxX [Paracoccus methylarcula]RNF35203.1 sulfur oxidation c-type cytochrome SoxX [Paracoccus methylarcula]
MPRHAISAALALLSGLAFAMPLAAETAPQDVSFAEDGLIEAPLSETAGDPENGAAIYADKTSGNCVACHAISDRTDAEFQGTIGPALDGAGDRWSEAQLRGIVADAKRTFPDSMMPGFYKSSGYIRPGDAFTGEAGSEPLPPLLTAQQVEDVIAYLATLKE